MARTRAPERPWVRARRMRTQSWTRCRIPVDQPIPYDLGREGGEPQRQNEWQKKLSFLTGFPGYLQSLCARDISDPESVLFITTWKDRDTLQSFTTSPAYSVYFQTFFGVPHAPSPSAFFTLTKGWIELRSKKVTIFTLSYPHPVAPEDRKLKLSRGLPKFPLEPRTGYNQSVWVREPQLLENGLVVENGILVQEWSEDYVYDITDAVFKDPEAREYWEGQVASTNPAAVEEVTWLFEAPEYSEEDEEIGEQEENDDDDDGNAEQTNERDDDSERDQILASAQLNAEAQAASSKYDGARSIL